MIKHITCINCPMGCQLAVELENDKVTKVNGNACKKGETYANAECTSPVRTVTALVNTSDGKPVSVKTNLPVPKDMVFQCLSEISDAFVTLPVKVGDRIIENICKTGADVIATKNLL